MTPPSTPSWPSGRTVLELLVAGVDIEVTSAVPKSTLRDLPRQPARTTFSAYGKPVTVRPPPADETTDDPAPTLPPG